MKYKSASWNNVSLLAQAGHSASVMPGSGCIIDFGFRVITLKSHRVTTLRRPLRRDPDRHAYGFRIASPRACHHAARLNMARPSGASFSPKSAPTPPIGTYMKSVLCHGFRTRTVNANLSRGIKLVCHHKQVTQEVGCLVRTASLTLGLGL